MAQRAACLLLLCQWHLVAGWWDGKNGMDPYSAAMYESKRAGADADVIKNDPDYFRRMFGKLATEQAQAKAMDETQHVSKNDMCMACHGVVVEVERMLKDRMERISRRRDELAITETLEGVCDLNRYQYLDPINPTKREEASRRYGGIAPPVFVNACRQVLVDWGDHDEIEEALLRGADPANVHAALRQEICEHKKYGLCRTLTQKIVSYKKDSLKWEEQDMEQCSDPNAGKKKKKKKAKKSPIEDMEYTIE